MPGLEPSQPSKLADNLYALFVAWQDQKTKRYYPVGRLLRQPNGNGPRYEFCYLRGIEEASKVGFSVFAAFPDERQVYISSELFPLFSNRLMTKSRPDFAEYVGRLDLDPAAADEFEILSRSGGRRETDSLELFPMPDLGRDGCYTTFFLAHGIRYLPEHSAERILSLKNGDRLAVQYDFQNEADTNALSLRTNDRVMVGYVPRYLLPDVFRLINECPGQPEISVALVNHPPAPIQQRLLCRMESCWPEGFKPYCDNNYLPLVATATQLDCSNG